MGFNRLKYLYFICFFLILALPLLNFSPWFDPYDWGKTVVFRIVLSILIFAFLWQFVLNKNQDISEKKSFLLSKKNKVFWILVSFLAVNFLATVFSPDRAFSLWGNPFRSGGFVNFAFYVIFAVLAFLILDKKNWQRVWDFSILIGVFISFIAVFQWQGLFTETLITYELRPPSTIGNPIFLAIYLLLLSFLALGFAIKEKNGLKKIFYSGSFLFFLFVIFLTYSRAAYLGLAIGLIYFIFFYPFKKRSLSLALKIVLVLMVLLGAYGTYHVNTKDLPEFIEKNDLLKGALSRLSFERALQDSRVSAWKVSWQALKSRPVLGYGPENFSIGFNKHYDPSLPGIEETPPPETTGWWDRAHNFIFDIGLTAGVPALLIYLALMGALFWQLRKIKRANLNEPVPITAHGIQAAFIGYLTANFFSFDCFSTYLIFFLLISYTLYLAKDNKTEPSLNRKKQERSNLNKWKIPIASLLAILLLWFVWAFNIKPMQINAQINQIENLIENKRCDLALEKIDKVLAKKSFLDGYLRLSCAGFLIECGQEMPEEKNLLLVKKAQELSEELAKIHPNYVRNYIMLASLINFRLGKEMVPETIAELKEKADYYLEKARKLSPGRREVIVEQIKNNLITGQYRKAKEITQECLDLNEKSKDCWWLKGLSNIYLKELSKAKEDIEKAGQMGYPVRSENSLLQLAKVYLDIENYQELLQIYLDLLKINPDDSGYNLSLMLVYKENGDFENAKKQALKIIELFPEYQKEVEEFLKTLP